MVENSIEVKPVQSRAEQRAFLNLPWQLYQGDENWIPPLRQNQKELAGFAPHPFYQNAKSQAFIAIQNGNVVGRILAIIDDNMNRHEQSRIGTFGFFEAIESEAVAKALFDAVKRHHGELGMELMRGPVNPSMNYECGLLIDGFDSPPVFMMTYNPPYYQRLYEQNELTKSHDLYAYLGYIEMLEDNEHRWKFIDERLSEKVNLKVRPMRRADFDQELRCFLEIYNCALPGSWGFVPITNAEMEHMAKNLRHLIVPEMTSVAEVDGRTVGVAFGMLDYNSRIKAIDGRLFPFGFLRLLWNKRNIKRIRMISTNVIPEFQKNKGIGLSLFAALIPALKDWKIKEVEYSWVLESNRLSRATLERCGTILYKTYRMYDFPLK